MLLQRHEDFVTDKHWRNLTETQERAPLHSGLFVRLAGPRVSLAMPDRIPLREISTSTRSWFVSGKLPESSSRLSGWTTCRMRSESIWFSSVSVDAPRGLLGKWPPYFAESVRVRRSVMSTALSRSAGFIQRLLILAGRVAVGNDSARPGYAFSPLENQRPGDASVHVAVEIDIADRPGMQAAAMRFNLVDDLHRSHLGRGHRAGRQHAPQGVECVAAFQPVAPSRLR